MALDNITDPVLVLSDLMENSVKSVQLCSTTGARWGNEILCLSHL